MRILIYSTAFPPQIGGLEEIARICADGFTSLGHDVTVLTESPNEPPVVFPFNVIRKPSRKQTLRAMRQSDVVLMFNMSLKAMPMYLLSGTPLVISHQGWYAADYKTRGLLERAKVWLSRMLATNIACSQAVADYLGGEATVIPNAYNDQIFRSRPEVSRDKDILFVGRLVSDKGADDLVQAMALLKARGFTPKLTITGSGPEAGNLERLVESLGLQSSVTFSGPLRGEALAQMMSAHQIMVVPSRWAEPFGIVALEGIASGCVVIVSQKGGLKEAVGPCGLTFENKDVEDLAEKIQAVLDHLVDTEVIFAGRANHLARHHAASAAQMYASVLVHSEAENRQNSRISK